MQMPPFPKKENIGLRRLPAGKNEFKAVTVCRGMKIRDGIGGVVAGKTGP